MQMKLIILFFSLLISLAGPLKGQDKSTITGSGRYFYGEGLSQSEREASDIALIQLTKSIAMHVTYDYTKTIAGTGQDQKETVTYILNTYAAATIKNVKTLKYLSGDKIEVFHYIEKEEVKRIFEERKKLIVDIFRKAEKYEEEANIGYALKWYYFATILMNSIPETNMMSEDVNLSTEISKRISNILDNTRFILKNDKMISEKERELTFDITINDKPVRLIEFSFWDGTNQVNVRAIDGEGIFRIVGPSVNFSKLDVDVKYNFYENKDEIKEVGELWNLVKKPVYTNSKKILLSKEELKTGINTLLVPAEKRESGDTEVLQKSNTGNSGISQPGVKTLSFNKGKISLFLSFPDSCRIIDKIAGETFAFAEILQSGSASAIREKYKNDLFLIEKLTNLFKNNQPSIAQEEINAVLNKTMTGWELRQIVVLNRYNSLKKQSKEYIVLDFDENGSLYDITFGMLKENFNYAKRQSEYGKDWMNRLTILKFIEKYRTSFLCRDISTLDSLFSDQAVIIVGRVLKRAEPGDVTQYVKLNKEQPEAVYMQYTKAEYLKNLERLFNMAQDIYIGYSQFDISKKNGNEMVYGISMRQNYYSSIYSDEGYLFLLVDFEKKQPQIYVRVWQPKEWDDDAVVKLTNFNINR